MDPKFTSTEAALLAAEVALTNLVDELRDSDRLLAQASAIRLHRAHQVAAASRADDAARRAHLAATGGRAHIPPRSMSATDVLERSIRLEISAALRISAGAADALLRTARIAIDRFPEIIEALEAGRMNERHVGILVREVDDLDDECADEVIEAALPWAEKLTPPKFERLVRRLAERLRDEPLEQRHARAVLQRRVHVTYGEDGMGELVIIDSAEKIRAAELRLNATAAAMKALDKAAAADGHGGDLQTTDQWRADAAMDLLIHGDTDHLPDGAREISADVVVTVPVLSLLNGDDRIHGAAELDGVGPIPIETARKLAGDATSWMRVLTHPISSVVLDVDRTRYRPPADLKRVVKWIHGTCTAPGCAVSAARCELDHIHEWQHGGPTSLASLHPACKGHHTIRHASNWQVDADAGPPGLSKPMVTNRVRWRSPGGTVTVSQPEHEMAPPF